MEKKELEKLPALIRRLNILSFNIEKAHTNGKPVMDVVKGGEATGGRGKGKPIAIFGMGHNKLPEWNAEFSEKMKQYLSMVNDIEEWIDGLPDNDSAEIDIKTIIEYKYRYGYSHAEIGNFMGYSKEAVTKKLKKFWENMQE